MSQGTKRRVDVVIVTAIPLEYEAVLKVSGGAVPGSAWREDKQPNGVAMAYRSFEVPKGRPLEVAVAVAPDMATAAALTTLIPLIEELKPHCIAMCGVCAGRPGKVQLGDVIAAERLYYHDTGKQSREDDKSEKHEQDLRTFNLRPDWKVELERMKPAELFRGQPWFEERPINTEWRARRALWALERGTAEPWREVDGALKDGEWRRVLEVLREEQWLDGIELTDAGRAEAKLRRFEYPGNPDLSPHGDLVPFKLHAAPMASGNKVIEDASIWGFVSQAMRKTLGLDMEAAAVGAAAHYLRDKKLEFLVMKGVMDFANHGRDDHFKAFAARASAECLLWFLRHHVKTPLVDQLDNVLSDGMEPLAWNPESLSGLLRAAHGLVPWRDQGRAALLAELDAWADDGRHKVSAWLLHAAGGAGKTRLAIEWVRRRQALAELAGFWKDETPVAKLDTLVTHPRPLVIVVDYAETAPNLVALLRAVATRDVPHVEIGCQRIRVLLLARGDGDWWTELQSHRHGLGQLVSGKEPRHLPPLAPTVEDRQSVWVEAVRAFAAHQGVAESAVVKILLDDPRYSRPLYLHLAALLAVEYARQDPAIGIARMLVTLDSLDEIMDAVLTHEEDHWFLDSAPMVSAAGRRLAREIVVAATLRGGVKTRSDAHKVFERLVERMRTTEDEKLLERLSLFYQRGDDSSFLPGLEPDLLGEAMVLRLAKLPARTGVDDAWVERAAAADGDELAITAAFTVLGRASEHDPHHARPWIDRLLRKDLGQRARLALRAAIAVSTRTAHAVAGDALADALERDGSVEIADALEGEGIPRPSVSLARVAEWQSRTLLLGAACADASDDRTLASRARGLALHGMDLGALGQRELALASTQEAVALYRALAEKLPDVFGPDLARSLVHLGNRQSELGQREAALASTQEAVGLYRALVEHHPDEAGADLAGSLANLGNRQSELGQREAALASTEEAVTRYRVLVENHPDAFEPSLGGSLNNLGMMQSALGDREAALASTQEAVALYRALAKQRPDAFGPDLAMSLGNLGNRQGELGQRETALASTQEAVGLYRALAKQRPDAFEPNLGAILANLGMMQSKLGRREAALALMQEAVALNRALAEQRPSASGPNLAGSLTNLGVMQSEVGQHEAALASTQEALALYRALAEQRPDAFEPDLAMSLTNLGNRQSELGQREGALASAQEAVALYRALAERHPDAFEPALAMSLQSLGSRQSEVGQREGALASTQEAVALYRALAEQHPDAFSPDLAGSLTNLGNRQSEVGQREGALVSTQEAVVLYRALANRRPDAFMPDLAMSAANLGMMQSEVGELEGALASTQEAVALYRTLAEQRPDVFGVNVGRSLSNLGMMQRALGQHEGALASTQEAVALHRALAERRPDAFGPDLAGSLNNLGMMQRALGQREAALASTQEAVALYRALAEQCPDAFGPDLAMSLNNLGNRQSALGQREAALASLQEAVNLYRVLAKNYPDAFGPDLAMSLNNLGNRQSELGQREAALVSTQEAVALYRALAKQRPDTFRPDLAGSLDNLGGRQGELGQLVAALASTHEALELYRVLTKQRPDVFEPDLARSLANLGVTQSALGQREAALASLQEAVGLYRVLAKQRPDVFEPDLARSLANLGKMQR